MSHIQHRNPHLPSRDASRHVIDRHAIDRLAIEQVVARYVHGLDAGDLGALDGTFLPDTHFDLSEAGGPVGPWTEVRAYYWAESQRVLHYAHSFTNLLLTFGADGQTAASKAKVINPVGMLGDDGQVHHFEIVGSYDDEWVKTDAGWRVLRRTWRHGWIWGDHPLANSHASPEIEPC